MQTIFDNLRKVGVHNTFRGEEQRPTYPVGPSTVP